MSTTFLAQLERRGAVAARRLVALVTLVLFASCAPEVVAPPAAGRAAVAQFGRDDGRGNLLGVQPWLVPADYASTERLRAKLGAWLDHAVMHGLVNDKTIVVLPEYVGAWLVVVDEGPDVIEAATIGDAMTALALAHPLEFAGALASVPAGVEDGMAHAAFAVKAEAMARAHVEVFGGIARDYGVVVTGASTLLPRPTVGDDGAIVVERGAPLQNVAFTFAANGAPFTQVTRKVFPTAAELPFVGGADVDDLPVFDVPAGKLGVLVCADSWFPGPYEVLRAKGADLLAVPVFVSGVDTWTATWRGYSGHDAPADVDVSADVGVLREEQAWSKYAMPARASRAGFTKALLVPLRGALWDLGDDGAALTVNGSALERTEVRDGPALVSLWL